MEHPSLQLASTKELELINIIGFLIHSHSYTSDSYPIATRLKSCGQTQLSKEVAEATRAGGGLRSALNGIYCRLTSWSQSMSVRVNGLTLVGSHAIESLPYTRIHYFTEHSHASS